MAKKETTSPLTKSSASQLQPLPEETFPAVSLPDDPSATTESLIDTLPSPVVEHHGKLVKPQVYDFSREGVLAGAQGDELVKAALAPDAGQPLAEEIIRRTRLDEITLAEQTELAVLIHERIGKAAGHIPDFASISENMKGAYLDAVKFVWLAAQRKTRTVS